MNENTEKQKVMKELMSGVNTVIFDFDNIIADSEPYHFKAYQKVFLDEGHTLDRDEYWEEWTFRGGGAEGEISRHGLDLDPDYIRSRKDPIYSEWCRSGEIEIFPEALEIIRTLDRKGYSMAVASGSYSHDILSIIDGRGLGKYFRAVIGKDMVENRKPDPETYLKAMEELAVDPSECLVIEDAVKGIISAHTAGIKAIGVRTEVTEGLDLSGADLVAENLSELRRLIDSL